MSNILSDESKIQVITFLLSGEESKKMLYGTLFEHWSIKLEEDMDPYEILELIKKARRETNKEEIFEEINRFELMEFDNGETNK